jgi:hypothetical protein
MLARAPSAGCGQIIDPLNWTNAATVEVAFAIGIANLPGSSRRDPLEGRQP